MQKSIHNLFAVLALCILAATGFLIVVMVSPPAPLPADAPSAVFSSGRAIEDLEIIAREPHPVGISPAHAEVRDHLLEEIRALGLEPQVQATLGVNVSRSGSMWGGFVENILVRLPGNDPEGAILLVSHYDSAPRVPGAVDSGSAVVTTLELLRALQAGPRLRQDVIALFSDGEEPGTIGAQAFVDQHPWFTQVRLAINMDQFWVGPPVLFHTSGGNGIWATALAHSASGTRPAHISFPFELFPSGATDLTPFILAGIPGAEFNGGGPVTEKHTTLDRPGLVDPGSLQQAGDQILALVRHLGSQPKLDIRPPDQTFFPVLGVLVLYPTSLAIPLALIAGLCLLGMLVFGFHTKQLTWGGLGLGFLTFLISLVLSLVLTTLVWRGFLAIHPEYAYNGTNGFRQRLSADALYALGFVALALAVSISAIAVAHKKISTFDLATGSLGIWLPLTIAATLLVPGTSYLLTWVLLTGSLALLLAMALGSRKNGWILSGLGFLVSAILTLTLWIPLYYIAILAGPMSPDTPLLSMLVGLVVLCLGSQTPLLEWITSPPRWLIPTAAWLVAFGFLVAGHLLVGKDSPPPLVNPTGYWLDGNHGEAFWIAFTEEMDDRQTGLLMDPARRSYTELFPAAPQVAVLTSTAPMLDLDGPNLEILADEWLADHRSVQARLTTSMHDRLYVIIPQEMSLLAISLPKNERIELPPAGQRAWRLRLDGMPMEAIDIRFEFSEAGPVQFLLVEERTGLPSFDGFSTQPVPGTMKSPGEFLQGIPTDFTAINRNFILPEINP